MGDSSQNSDAQRTRAKCDPAVAAQAIREAGGMIAEAAKALPISRSTLFDYCRKFDDCRKARQEGRTYLADLSRETIKKAMELAGGEVSWSEALKAAKIAQKYDPETEPDKHEHSISDDQKEEKLKELLGPIAPDSEDE